MIETTVAPVVDEDFIALALDHLKIEAGDEETAYADVIAQYVDAALGLVEAASGRLLFTRTMRFTADAFGTALVIPASPVISITTVTYSDTDGATQTLAGSAYALIDKTETPTLYPVYGTEWPTVRDFPGSVVVTFTAGYGANMEDIPAPLKQAVLQTVADAFRFGGNVATTSTMELPASARRLCMNYRRAWA